MARLDKKTVILIHVIAWVVFITYEVPISQLYVPSSAIDEYVCFYIPDICLFYINAEIIFRDTGRRDKIIPLLIPIMLLELVVFFSLSLGIGILLFKLHNHWKFYEVTRQDCGRAIWRGVYIMGLSVGYAFFLRAIRSVREKNEVIILQLETERKRIEIEKDLIKTQNAYLQSQINRHLLFNTLTFIYNSVFRIAPDAGQSVLLLSETMHYALSEHGEGKVPLSEEIQQIERYIQLNELRFGHRLKLVFKTDVPEDCAATIPPLLLLTFVENIFKHGNLTSVEDDANIFIVCTGNLLTLHTENYKKGWGWLPKRKHIGIANARTRLQSYYGTDNFELILRDTEERFIVDLIIKL